MRQVAKLYGAAFMKAASVETVVNGFRNTGIFPLDPNISPNWMFQPSGTTDLPLAEVILPHPTPMAEGNGCDDADSPPYNNSRVSRQSVGEITGTSGIQSNKHEVAFKISPQDILRVSQAEREAECRNKRRGKTAILTDSPFKNELTSTVNVKKQKKTTKRRLHYEITGTSKESTQKQRKPDKKIRGKLHLFPGDIFKLQNR
jgi:hypothetical protein